MPILVGLSGLREVTGENLHLDACVAYKNVNVDLLRSTGTWAAAILESNSWTTAAGNLVIPKKLGATRDGTAVNVGGERRQVEVDSRRLPVMELTRISGMEPTVRTSFLEIGDFETLQLALTSSDVVNWPSNGDIKYKEVTPRLYVKKTDYVGNIALAGKIAGKQDPMVVVLDNVLCVEDPEFASEDDNEMVVPVVLMGHAPLSNPTAVPIHFFSPQVAATGS